MPAPALPQENEPDIFNAIKFGCILENVVFDEETRGVDYDSNRITENTRASYPIEHIGGQGWLGCAAKNGGSGAVLPSGRLHVCYYVGRAGGSGDVAAPWRPGLSMCA